MLARDYSAIQKQTNPNVRPPILLCHRMLKGLKGQHKMSKNEPESAIFVDDPQDVVESKIKESLCPQTVHENPILEHYQFIVFSAVDNLDFKKQSGEVVKFVDYEQLENAFVSGKITGEELKSNLCTSLDSILQPVRKHFTTNRYANDLLKKAQQYSVASQ